MRISGIPKATKKIYTTPSKTPFKAWNRHFKLLDDKTLLKLIKSMVTSGKNYERSEWDFAGIALSELHTRRWGKKHPNKLLKLKQSVETVSRLCFSSRGYSLEVAGIVASPKKSIKKAKVVHPYAYSKIAQKILYRWEDSRTKKSLGSYIASRIPKEEVRYLKNHTITYLPDKKLDKYRVTFQDGFIRIGGKIPKKDGWYIFVLGGDPFTLLAGIKKTGTFHHTSFFSGTPVPCAGEFRIEDGRLVRIQLRSGHYRPTVEHGEVLREFLARPEYLGPIAASTFLIEPHDN